VLLVVVGVAQADSDTKTPARRQTMRSFFMGLEVFWAVTCQARGMFTPLAGGRLWGIDRPSSVLPD
jgi:hypothetical protein